MSQDKKQLTATNFEEFTPFSQEAGPDSLYPVRDANNHKLDASDLFAQFTANIIKEDVPFIR
ncbi:MAG: hypothetical protein ABIU63_13600 [Chitinophagaceae bacterium]